MAYDADPTISRYITMVQGYPQLSREDELALAKRWSETGDQDAADQDELEDAENKGKEEIV